MLIRELKKIDINFYEKVEELFLLEEKIFLFSAYTFFNLKEFFEDKNYKIFIAENNNEILAYLLIMDGIDSYDILKIGIKTEYRGMGIGEKLLENILDKNIFLEVRKSNLGAIKFYEKNKFIKISERKNYYKDNNEDAIIMMREASEL